MIKDAINAKGHLSIVVKDDKGNVKESREIPNLVVTTGLGVIASRLVGTSTAVMSHMAVGTDATAAALGQTALIAEVGRVALTSGTSSGAVVTYVATFPAGTGTGALQEAGLFNATPAGTMLSRATYAVINKGASDTVTITWTITIS